MTLVPRVINYKITCDATTSDDQKTKLIVLNSFLRWYPLVNQDNTMITLSRKNLSKLCAIINHPPRLKLGKAMVEGILSGFLKKAEFFKAFLTKCTIKPSPGTMERKARIYLHKIHRLAPVFDYQRAVINLNSLHLLFIKQNFFPSISTQLALVVYITDSLEKKNAQKLMQKNIRYLCNCSAYAFHMAKNRLGIDGLLKKTP